MRFLKKLFFHVLKHIDKFIWFMCNNIPNVLLLLLIYCVIAVSHFGLFLIIHNAVGKIRKIPQMFKEIEELNQKICLIDKKIKKIFEFINK